MYSIYSHSNIVPADSSGNIFGLGEDIFYMAIAGFCTGVLTGMTHVTC